MVSEILHLSNILSVATTIQACIHLKILDFLRIIL